jgi:hypothetical protein
MRTRLGSLLLCLLFILSVTSSHVAAAHRASSQDVIASYYDTLNAALTSGDLSGVVAFYAPDATLTQSNALGITQVFHGRTAIAGYYKGLYAKFPGAHFTLTGSQRNLSPSILFRYEIAGTPSMTVPARCAHLFILRSGLIVTDDWVTYFPGK